MAGPSIDMQSLQSLMRRLPLARGAQWAKAHAEKLVFWGLLCGLLYTCFLVWKALTAPDQNPLPQVSVEAGQDASADAVLRPAGLRGYRPSSDFASVTMRNPF